MPKLPTKPNPMPRYRGFNLSDMFVLDSDPRFHDMTPDGRARFQEDDFRWIAGWGFDFVRLPLTYQSWAPREDPGDIDEAKLAPLDDAVGWGRKHGVHVSICLHHAPGYCVNIHHAPEHVAEPRDLWTSPEKQAAFVHTWETFARRYAGVPASELSFDLVNEPKHVSPDEHNPAAVAATEAIRAVSPDRPVVADGLEIGRQANPGLIPLGVWQSCRGYSPGKLTHHKAWWGGGHPYEPAVDWPLVDRTTGEVYGREDMAAEYDPWVELIDAGVGVHCGEMGCYHHTPHGVFLRWMEDLLQILREREMGWALWNFRGSFGMLDSGRADAPYTDWHGHQLDHKLLELLQRY